MKTNIFIFVLFAIALVNCKKDETPLISFHPTDIIIGQMGSQMRFSIKGPFVGIYNFSADTSMLNFTGEEYYVFQVPTIEMEELAKCLSDTIIFNWKIQTSMSPYPENECELHVVADGYGAYMCSIGEGNEASNIIRGLSNTITGEAKEAFDEIAILLSD